MIENIDPVKGDVQVWWIPNSRGRAFTFQVPDTSHAVLLLNALGQYDTYLGKGIVACNVGGVEMFDGEEWMDLETLNELESGLKIVEEDI